MFRKFISRTRYNLKARVYCLWGTFSLVVLIWLSQFFATEEDGPVSNIFSNRKNFYRIKETLIKAMMKTNLQYLQSLSKDKPVVRKSKYLLEEGDRLYLKIRIKNAIGKNMVVNYNDNREKETNSLSDTWKFIYAEPPFGNEIQLPPRKGGNDLKKKPFGYVRVFCRSWEQLTMSTSSLFQLAALARIGDRRVLQPMVNDSRFASEGHPLGIYFNLTDLNTRLIAGGYATLVDKLTYDSKCSSENASHVTIHFLYHDSGKSANKTKKLFNITDEEYQSIRDSAKERGWIECPFIGKLVDQETDHRHRFFCVDPFVITEWSSLENDVVRGANCLTIVTWKGVGSDFRTQFSVDGKLISVVNLVHDLKFSSNIIDEVQKFQKTFLRGRYIAVHVRGEKVYQRHNFDRLKACIHLLLNIVHILKEQSKISHVFLATDMSKFGSKSWDDDLMDGNGENRTLMDIQDTLVSGSGGVVYLPTDEHLDHGVVALVEMTIISQAEHLVMIGCGSYQKWSKAKFLKHHEDKQRLWSLTQLCTDCW